MFSPDPVVAAPEMTLAVCGDGAATRIRDRVGDSSDSRPSAATESRLSMHYFDSRGVFRVFEASIDERAWRCWWNAPGFSQRFTGDFAEGGSTMSGTWELCRDGVHWDDDLQITYRRK